jgi:uncharacterized membrane protein YhaH (DUF805 family)
MFEALVHYAPIIQILLLLGFFYLGVRNSGFLVKRAGFWGAFAAAVLSGVFLNMFLENFYLRQSSEAGVYLGLALQFALSSVIVFFYAKMAAGRARDAGYSKNAAWAVWVPLIGPLWLGIVRSSRS